MNRWKKTVRILWCAALVSFCFSCGKKQLEKHIRTSLTCGFDTAVTLLAYTYTDDQFDEYYRLMCEEFIRYNQLFDIYHDYDGVNNLKTINDMAGKQAVEVDEAIVELLDEAYEYYRLTNGAFDISQGKLLSLWHDYREEGIRANNEGNMDPPIPCDEELQSHYTVDGWSHIRIDHEAKTVYIDDPEISLDAGGIAKGFAAEMTARKLEENGLKTGAVNAGGNVRLIGMKPDDSKWTIGIQQPENILAYVGNFYLDQPFSLATSGDYQRFYISGGQMYSHIIDPSTGMPSDHFRCVTVLTHDAAIADILSTALFVMDYEQGCAWLDEYNQTHTDFAGAYWVFGEKPEGIEVIGKDGYYVTASENIRSYIDVYGAAKGN